jgi:hypothetical protein
LSPNCPQNCPKIVLKIDPTSTQNCLNIFSKSSPNQAKNVLKIVSKLEVGVGGRDAKVRVSKLAQILPTSRGRSIFKFSIFIFQKL